ncbi:hypothetical protein L7F22_060054 [Adiantum nelumboides]|nr:hypothetical protein [Adiantum nelumboides]
MEASAAAPQPHGPPAAERDGHQAPLQPQPIIDNPSKQQDVGRSIESQEHQSSEKTDMNVSPSISSNQDHHREPKIIPEEPNHNKPASEVNSRKTTPEHSHPTLSASEEQNSPFKNLCQNDALKPATTLDGHHKEPYSMKAETGTPSEHLNKPVSNNVSSQQSHETAASHPTNPPTESQPSATAVLSEHQSHHTTDSVDDLIKPDDPHKDKLTSVHEELNPVAAQQDEIKSPLDQQHITTSTANNVNVQHPQHGLPRLPSEHPLVELPGERPPMDLTMQGSVKQHGLPRLPSEHPLVELPGERPPMDLTMQGSVKPFAEMLQSTTEKPQTFSTSPQQESENKQQVGATKECQVASVLEEAQQNSTGKK